MKVSNHIKVKWSIRGDYNRSVSEAWANGTRVRLPNYSYGSAMYDHDAEIALLSNGDRITTALTVYGHTEMLPLEKVGCADCGCEFQQCEDCPSCGSDKWRSI